MENKKQKTLLLIKEVENLLDMMKDSINEKIEPTHFIKNSIVSLIKLDNLYDKKYNDILPLILNKELNTNDMKDLSKTEYLDKISEKFLSLKILIDKYPKAFSIKYDEKIGYILCTNVEEVN